MKKTLQWQDIDLIKIIVLLEQYGPATAQAVLSIVHAIQAAFGVTTDEEATADLIQLIEDTIVAKAEADAAARGNDPR